MIPRRKKQPSFKNKKLKNSKYRIKLLWKVFPSWSSNLNVPGLRKMMQSCQAASYCSLDRKGRGRSHLRITSLQSSRNSTDKSWVREDVQTALWAVMAQFRMLDCVNHNWSLLCNLYCAWRGQVCSINIYGYIYFAFKMETAVMYKAKTNQWKCWIWNHCIPITSKNVVLCYYFLLKYLLTMKYLNSKDLNFSKRIKFTLKLRWWDFICKALRGGGGEK